MEILIYNGTILNEGQAFVGSVLIRDGLIEGVFPDNAFVPVKVDKFDATGKYILPGAIDTHVHFREPGLTYKGDIFSESRAALAGGVTSFLDMPNTVPPTVDASRLHEKLRIASRSSAANYGFYLAATKDNMNEIRAIPQHLYPGIKIFYAPSTGNLICNDTDVLEHFFSSINKPFVLHSEDNDLLKQAMSECKDMPLFPDDIHIRCRPHSVCVEATQRLLHLGLATRAQLHFLHISTAAEVELLRRRGADKITAEVCPHYLWYDSRDYARKRNLIKVNPSIKSQYDREALIRGLAEGLFQTIGTDHAPHLPEEKERDYWKSPSGAPSVQHYYPVVFEIFRRNGLEIKDIPGFSAHAPAEIFHIKGRGYIRPGYKADIAIVEQGSPGTEIYHKCGWSVFDGAELNYKVYATFVNGRVSYLNGKFFPSTAESLNFN